MKLTRQDALFLVVFLLLGAHFAQTFMLSRDVNRAAEARVEANRLVQERLDVIGQQLTVLAAQHHEHAQPAPSVIEQPQPEAAIEVPSAPPVATPAPIPPAPEAAPSPTPPVP